MFKIHSNYASWKREIDPKQLFFFAPHTVWSLLPQDDLLMKSNYCNNTLSSLSDLIMATYIENK